MLHTNSNTDEPWMPKYTHHYNLCYTTLYRLWKVICCFPFLRSVAGGQKVVLDRLEVVPELQQSLIFLCFLLPPPPPPPRHLWPPWIVWNIARTSKPWLDELRVEAQCVLHCCWLGAWHTATVSTCLACSTEGGGPVCFALLLARCLTHSYCLHLFSLFNWGWRPSVFCTVAGSVLDTQLLSPLV